VGEPVSRDEILEKVWGAEGCTSQTTAPWTTSLVKLRKRSSPNHERPRHILTVYGYGYKLVV